MQRFGIYEIEEKLQETKYTDVYKAVHSVNKTKVILKALKGDFPSQEQIARLNTEFQILAKIDSPLVIKVFSVEKEGNSYAIVMEDIDGLSLREQYRNKLKLSEFFKLAILMAYAVKDVHKKNVIHKDINPSNFIYNANKQTLKIIDFGISTTFIRENTILENPNLLEGTLSYISPEQTGRMNRALDYRTDFYSLGITYYELLTGKLPFNFADPMELVHSHIARKAISPHEFDSSIPIPLSDLVMKLISKTAEERYVSNIGLIYDLEKLGSGISNYENSFPSLATKDISDKFQIPQKLYGREKEIEMLLSAYNRAILQRREILLIVGYSGIGKSCLVSEIYKPVTESRGYFIAGKFDQYNRNIPYKAFVNIFQDLIKQLLSETESQLGEWREKLLNALGENAQIILDVIPDLELIIGKQPPVDELGINESQNRFKLVFQNFIKVFTKEEHPIVIFLDDLQWSDEASLKLMQLLMSSSATGLLLVGAYRNNEVSELHPLTLVLNEIESTGAIVNYISLSPLNLENISQIIADTVKSDDPKINELADLIFLKTGGNPFFMNQFLMALSSESLIEFDYNKQSWTWEIHKISERGFTDNVVDLMTTKLQRLPDVTQNLLKLAACIGNQFDLKTLGLVAEDSQDQTLVNLHPAISENFLIQIGTLNSKEYNNSKSDANISKISVYKFSHDRVQQAAYASIPKESLALTHYQIGKLIEKQISKTEKEEKIFTIVNQLNFGISLIQNELEKTRLAELNLTACKKARLATAYMATIEYAKIGILLLGSNAWSEHYKACLELHELAVEAASLSGEFELMIEWIDIVLKNAKTPIDQVQVFFVKIQSLASQNKLPEAIAAGKLILEKLGVHFPNNVTVEDFRIGINEISSLMKGRKPTDLFNLPKMQDPATLAIMNIAACLIPTCYNAGSPLFPLVIILQVNFSIRFGNSPISTFSYTNYGILLNNIMQDVPLSDEFRQLAYRLAMEPESKPIRSGTLIGTGIFLLHRTNHLKETLSILQNGYQVGLETGALEMVGYGGYAFSLNSFWRGEKLPKLKLTISSYREKLKEVNQLTAANYCSIFLNATLILLSDNEDSQLANQEFANEKNIVKEALASGDQTRLFYFYLHRLFLRFLFEETDLAVQDILKTRTYLMAGGGTIGEVNLYFIESLTLLSNFFSSTNKDDLPLDQKPEWKRVEENQIQLENWAKHAPMNYLHKWVLVEAEKSRVLSKRADAEDLYERAIELAKTNGYIQDEAIANELYGKFWLALDKKEFGRMYLRKAHYAYSVWGAKGKLELLERTFPDLIVFSRESDRDFFGDGTIITSTTSENTTRMEANASLDFISIMKASQIISGEIILEKLLTSLMKVLAENAGAEKGFLILERQDKLILEAAWDSNSSNLDFSKIFISGDNELLSTSIVNFVFRTKKNLVINDVIKEKKFKDQYILKNKPKSVLCIPLLNQGKLIGVVYLENNLSTGVFTNNRIEVIKMLSAQAAISIENAKLYSNLENITKEKTRISTEMEIARDIQSSLLPKEPILSDFEVATYMFTAELVGGDYYDVIQTEDKEWFLMGDVSGHGVTAGLIMMMVQTAIHTILNSVDTKDPSVLLSKVNKVITSNIHKMKLSKYMTLTLFLKEKDGQIYYSGMHQDLILYIAKEKKVKIIETKGSWIGYFDLHNEFEVDTIKMESGDVLLLFTDGITESTNKEKEMYEIEGLKKLLNQYGDQSAEKIKNILLESLKEFQTDDDITFMVCKRK